MSNGHFQFSQVAQVPPRGCGNERDRQEVLSLPEQLTDCQGQERVPRCRRSDRRAENAEWCVQHMRAGPCVRAWLARAALLLMQGLQQRPLPCMHGTVRTRLVRTRLATCVATRLNVGDGFPSVHLRRRSRMTLARFVKER